MLGAWNYLPLIDGKQNALRSKGHKFQDHVKTKLKMLRYSFYILVFLFVAVLVVCRIYIFTARQRSCGKVMLSQVSVCHYVQGWVDNIKCIVG